MSQALMDSMSREGFPFQSSNTSENKMIIISDGDIILNSIFQGAPTDMGMNPFTIGTQKQYPFANRQFIKNCIEYLVNNSGLNESASKAYTLRLIDKKKVEDERIKWQVINIVIPIMVVCVFAIIYLQYRKRKYRLV